MDLLLQNINIVIFLVLICVGYGAGSYFERRHYASIHRREREMIHLPVITTEWEPKEGTPQKAELVTGNVVVSIDYFKRLLAILRNIFGGNVGSYESLVDRARREAILRLKEEAIAKGANMVVNLRLETAAIGNSANQKRQVGSVEVVAYGTAYISIEP